jgi:hypothetical protein
MPWITRLSVLIASTLAILPASSHAGWLDWVQKQAAELQVIPPTGTQATALTEDEIVRGLKEALATGTRQAVSLLGKEGGYLNNAKVKIPMPENLAYVERTLRAMGQAKLADEFVTTLNRAAEKAVPEAAAIFADSISKMSLQDAKTILSGPDDAATQYFRKTSEGKLTERFQPLVKAATDEAGVTSSYKRLMQQLGPFTQYLGKDAGDLDGYITGKAMDGLFLMIAEEEKRIRTDPVARGTELLKKVFGTAKP